MSAPHQIICGDGIAGLLSLAPGSVALVLTDPPWGATRARWDKPLPWREWWAAIDHVLAPGGIAAVFSSVRLALEIAPLAPRRFAYDLVWEKNKASGHAATRRSKSELYGRETITVTNAGTTSRYATSILKFDVVDNDAEIRIHPTQKPVRLLRWIIRAYSRPGDLVVDPTCGSGSAVHAARAEGRAAIGWEADATVADKAQRWLDGRDLPLFGGVA